MRSAGGMSAPALFAILCLAKVAAAMAASSAEGETATLRQPTARFSVMVAIALTVRVCLSCLGGLVLASLLPPSGPSAGGTSVTIRGSGFVGGATMCRFGGGVTGGKSGSGPFTVAALVASPSQVCMQHPTPADTSRH